MTAYNLGYQNFFGQIPLQDCPFDSGTDEEDNYYRGWLAGEKDWEASCEGYE